MYRRHPSDNKVLPTDRWPANQGHLSAAVNCYTIHNQHRERRFSAGFTVPAVEHRSPIDVATATCFFGHATTVAGTGGRVSHIPEAIFAYLKRNAVQNATPSKRSAVQEERRYHVPPDRVIEVGEQISL